MQGGTAVLSKTDRKEAIRKFKDRKPARGVFAVRCTANGNQWVDSTMNLEAAKNGAWFSLRHGSYRDKVLQAEWNAYGEQAFEYEILERLDDDVSPLALADLLKEKKRHWTTQLGARPVQSH
jgi:hypothetical protein